MTALRYLLASLKQYRRVHLAVAAGVLVATAVITGALLVGDSVRGSLHGLVLERLGRIEQMLVAEQPFRAELADELGNDETVPLLLVPGTLAVTEGEQSRRATQLSIIGHDENFWALEDGDSPAPLAGSPLTGDQVAISQSIAAELNVEVGDEILLRVPLTSSMPADSVLGEKADTTASRRLEVAVILPNTGLARFSLRPSQQPPRNVFLPLATLQKLLDLSGRVNAVAVVGEVEGKMVGSAKVQARLGDFGIGVTRVNAGAALTPEYLRITAKRLVLPTALSAAVEQAFPDSDVQPAVTYLANTITLGDRKIPYSTITGIDSVAQIGPLWGDAGQPLVLADDEIVLNDWAAANLDAKVGDLITFTYYQPETTHGVLREAQPVTLKLRAIVPLLDGEGNKTLANDLQLTPDLPGVTDQRSISDWDLPFALTEKIRDEDEKYWDDYATTPKAFVSYTLAKKLWSTRWGTDSVLRLAASDLTTGNDITIEQIHQRVKPDPADMGMMLLPIREQGLAAARGTTAFEGLFLGFSFFLMASAIMLISLLFRLGVESRASEIGLLTAVGWTPARLQRVWLAEAAIVAFIGASVGVLAGIGYARLMIHGLSTWWVAATVTPFLKLHVPPISLALGFGIGMLVALATIAWSLRQLLKIPARQLLTGDCTDPAEINNPNARRWLPITLIAVALLLGTFATQLEGEAQAGAFFGGGALVLTALLIGLRQRLRQVSKTKTASLSLAGLSVRNARRYPARTILSVGLAAVASFLIVALSAFRLAPTEKGTGGFKLLCTSDLPLHFDLGTEAGREELGFDAELNQQLEKATLFGFRIRAGEDASCLNLYQTAQPQVVGVPESFSTENQFGWAATIPNPTANLADEKPESPWALLATDLGNDEAGRPVVPIVLDKNTAMYSLHLFGLGARMTIKDAFDQPITLEVVGQLANSVLQGKVLLSETHFLRLFPDTSGQQLFLIRKSSSHRTNEGDSDIDLTTLLETQLEDYGFDAVSTTSKLAGFFAVQNTYLSTFQSLGALGLLLGTFGLAVAQLRSVLQRRGELALLRSTGFRRSRLAQMVLSENMVLLLTGLAIGTIAALVAVLPHYLVQNANIPWTSLLGLLASILLAGLLAGWLAVRAAVNAPLLPSLRGD